MKQNIFNFASVIKQLNNNPVAQNYRSTQLYSYSRPTSQMENYSWNDTNTDQKSSYDSSAGSNADALKHIREPIYRY